MRRMLRLTGALALLVPSGPAEAQGLQSTGHRHLGFFLQLDSGFGYLRSTAGSTASLPEISISGPAFSLAVGVGGAVAEDTVLAGQVWTLGAISQTITVGGLEASAGDTTLVISGFGPTFVYYFMPANLFLSVTPSLTTVQISGGGISGETQLGFGLRAAVGKEWWVGDHWGIGLTGQLYLASNKDKGVSPPTWTSFGGVLAFSATYN